MTREAGTARNPPGTVVRVNGPLVEVEGLVGVAMSEMVELGPLRLPGELVALADGVATVQAYDYSGGLAPGHVARPLGEPLSAWLGPGLLGGMFDGLVQHQKLRADLSDLQGLPVDEELHPDVGGVTVCRADGRHGFEAGTGGSC